MESEASPAGREDLGGGAAPARRPTVVEVAEGEWRREAPPDLQAQFRCIVHPRGSAILPERWTAAPEHD